MQVDTSRWCGDGELTRAIVERLGADARIAEVRVEDAPAAHENTGYTFISNEVFIRAAVEPRAKQQPRRWWRRPSRNAAEGSLTLADVEAMLIEQADIGRPDFSDEGMLQYLRTERIIPPYQTRGYKIVELIRLYMAASSRSR